MLAVLFVCFEGGTFHFASTCFTCIYMQTYILTCNNVLQLKIPLYFGLNSTLTNNNDNKKNIFRSLSLSLCACNSTYFAFQLNTSFIHFIYNKSANASASLFNAGNLKHMHTQSQIHKCIVKNMHVCNLVSFVILLCSLADHKRRRKRRKN